MLDNGNFYEETSNGSPFLRQRDVKKQDVNNFVVRGPFLREKIFFFWYKKEERGVWYN